MFFRMSLFDEQKEPNHSEETDFHDSAEIYFRVKSYLSVLKNYKNFSRFSVDIRYIW